MAAKHWIAQMHMKKGAFTAQAKAHGMGVQEYARHVLAPNSHASTTTKRRAVLAERFAQMNHRR